MSGRGVTCGELPSLLLCYSHMLACTCSWRTAISLTPMLQQSCSGLEHCLAFTSSQCKRPCILTLLLLLSVLNGGASSCCLQPEQKRSAAEDDASTPRPQHSRWTLWPLCLQAAWGGCPASAHSASQSIHAGPNMQHMRCTL